MNTPTIPDQELPPEGNHRSKSRSRLPHGLAAVGITSGYIFGPMIVFGGVGWVLAERFDHRIILFVALFIGLVISNILIFTQTEKAMKRLQSHDRN